MYTCRNYRTAQSRKSSVIKFSLQQMRQINAEGVSHLQTSEKNRKVKQREKGVTSTPGAKPGPQHWLEQQNGRASRVLTHKKWHSAGNCAHITDHSEQAGLSQTHFGIFAVDEFLCLTFSSTGNTDYFWYNPKNCFNPAWEIFLQRENCSLLASLQKLLQALPSSISMQRRQKGP